jgi:hypothetical protein
VRSQSKDKSNDLFKSQTMVKKHLALEASPGRISLLGKVGSTRSNNNDHCIMSEPSTDRDYYTKSHHQCPNQSLQGMLNRSQESSAEKKGLSTVNMKDISDRCPDKSGFSTRDNYYSKALKKLSNGSTLSATKKQKKPEQAKVYLPLKLS